MHALHGNTKLGLITLNLRGAQTPGDFERLVQECSKWRYKGIHAFAFQEHNLNPNREENLKRICKARDFTLTISFAPGDQTGETADVHWGGTLILTDDKILKINKVCIQSRGLTMVQAEWAGEKFHIASMYAPAQGELRKQFFASHETTLPNNTLVGGDFNVVPDVTLDVQSRNPLAYDNKGIQEMTK